MNKCLTGRGPKFAWAEAVNLCCLAQGFVSQHTASAVHLGFSRPFANTVQTDCIHGITFKNTTVYPLTLSYKQIVIMRLLLETTTVYPLTLSYKQIVIMGLLSETTTVYPLTLS